MQVILCFIIMHLSNRGVLVSHVRGNYGNIKRYCVQTDANTWLETQSKLNATQCEPNA